MPLLSDLRTDGGAHYLYDLVDAPNVVSALGAGDTAETEAPDATVFTGTPGFASGDGATATTDPPAGGAIGYAIVTISENWYTGPGSIFYPSNFDGTPAAGDTVRYPTTNGFQILPDGTIIVEAYGEYICYYDDGTGEVEFTVVIDDSAQVYADGAAATTSAPDASLYGGVNISGTGATATASAPTGTATAGNIATGAGATATATAPDATVTAGAEVAADGVEIEAIAPDGVGENIVHAEGDGVEVTTESPDATASGDVFGEGEGVTVVAATPQGVAIGDRRPGSIPYLALTVVYPRTVLIARAAA